MAIPVSGTFEYMATVPDRAEGQAFTCECRARTDSGSERRLVGSNPTARFEPAGPTPDAGPDRPFVMRTRITLQPRLIDRVKASSVSFHVDEALINRRTAGDVMHIARTNCGGLAMSVLRRDGLVYAVGAVTAVPLGTGIDVRIPLDVIANAKALFQKHDPECEFPESPIAIRAGNMTSILFRGRREIGPYKIFVKHGHLNGIPGIDECMSIVRTGSCSAEAASVSAILLADPAAVAVS